MATLSVSNAIDRQLLELFAKYKAEAARTEPGENIELEIRFRDITRDAFESLYTAISNNPEFATPVLECSVNIISENIFERSTGGKRDDTQYIRRILFRGSTASADTYMKKSRLMRPVHVVDYVKYNVGLAKESDCEKFSASDSATVRFKVRASFDYIGDPPHAAKWRFDLTAVKQGTLKDLGPSMRTIKKDLFTDALSTSNFLRELKFDMVDSLEIEIEHIDAQHDVTLDDMAIIKKVFSLINPQYITDLAYQDEIYHIASYVVTNPHTLDNFKKSTHRLKQLSNQVIALSKNTYYADVFPADGWYCTDKADGQRALVSISGNRCRILRSDTMKEYLLHTQNEVNAGKPSADAKFTQGPVTIADVELLTLDDGKPAIRVFDVIVDNDNVVADDTLGVRIGHIDNVVASIAAFVPDVVVAAIYERLDGNNLEAGYRKINDTKRNYDRDGVIISDPNSGYASTKHYKWKPLEQTTIDFLAIKCPSKLLGIRPYDVIDGQDLYLLFVGIDHRMREKLGIGFIAQYRQIFPQHDGHYYPIQFSPSANPLAYLYWHSKKESIDHKIVELSRNADNAWSFHRVREDRKMEKGYYGNDFRVAELTYVNYIDVFNFEDLWQKNDTYFTKTATDIYTAGNKFRRFVISNLLKDNVSGVKWVVDEAAGRGGDLHRYQEIGVENALFIDIDSTAIAELIRRKFSFFAAKKRHVKDWYNDEKKGGGETKLVTAYDRIHGVEYDKLIVKDVKALTVHTLVADLKTPASELIASTYQYGINTGLVNGIICNFALHYMCDTIENLRNLLLFNVRLLKIGGVFIFTVLNGRAVFDLLAPLTRGQQWESRENDVLKYAIKKTYTGDKMSAVGQNIEVLLPFSDEMYSEPLCNLDTVIAEATRLGFEVELNSPMSSYMERFVKAERMLAEKLTDGDREYIKLFQFVSLRKVREPKTGGRR